MSEEKLVPGVNPGDHGFKEAVCIMAEKVYDSCKDKDCLSNLRVHLPCSDANILERALNVRCREAEIIWVYTDIEPVPFNHGYYTVDIKFFFKVTFDAFLSVGKPCEICGLATYDKKVILFGSEGAAKIYTSNYVPGGGESMPTYGTNMPKAVVEAVDPICLGVKVVDSCREDESTDAELSALPSYVLSKFEEASFSSGGKRLYVTLGLFTIIKLIRNVQLLIPCYDFCIPEKTCVGPREVDPCSFFRKIKFPFDEFCPPQLCDLSGGDDDGCGCSSDEDDEP